MAHLSGAPLVFSAEIGAFCKLLDGNPFCPQSFSPLESTKLWEGQVPHEYTTQDSPD
jgi:hypothetical protein